MNQLQAQGSSQLPAQTIPNPKGNVNAITLKSGKSLQAEQQQNSNSTDFTDSAAATDSAVDVSNSIDNQKTDSVPLMQQKNNCAVPLPFPHRAVQSRRGDDAEKDKELLETFRKVEVNISLLDAIKQIPKYAKFLKELCTHKRRLKDNERINMSRNISALIQPMPHKCKDPRTFTIPCIIGNSKFENTMLDLGASINVMPMFVFNSLGLRPLHATSVVI